MEVHTSVSGGGAPLAEARREDADHDRDSVEQLVKHLGRGAHRHRVEQAEVLPQEWAVA
jgi:hypothetical protein